MAKSTKIDNRFEELANSFQKIGEEQRKTIDHLSMQISSRNTLLDALAPYFAQQEKLTNSIYAAIKTPDLSAITNSILPNKHVIDSIQKITNSSLKFQESVRSLIKPAISPEFIDKILKIRERQDRTATTLRDILLKHKFFLTPYLAENTYDEILLRDLKNGTESPWNYFNNLFSTTEEIEGIKTFWSKNPIYIPRMVLLERALNAHLAKDYIVSIPLFLIQIDGIITEIYPNQKQISKRKKAVAKTKPKETINAVNNMLAVYQDLMGESVISNIICEEMLKTWFPQDQLHRDTYPNRHQILHGGDLNYFEGEYYSLRCLLIVDGLEILHNLINPKIVN